MGLNQQSQRRFDGRSLRRRLHARMASFIKLSSISKVVRIEDSNSNV
jgi:hypothetical protein